MSPLRNLPSVDKLVQVVQQQPAAVGLPRELLVQAARHVLAETRRTLREEQHNGTHAVDHQSPIAHLQSPIARLKEAAR
ncbi:MAG: hypothetical protein MUD01_19940 [Chloroflexaceae bacterium]|nr:hypothetical protein [Chloroflexaceae bacterium]